ncbi:7792_t:CDS:2 [Funneliformis mosseae]|uniref:7792_t:CDS:1 n=1 Tax=Funneliformis mosseae TaxID=27381 RepID=A0A9N8V0T3_FUNMO|nr:7792_t:CDS:2 [Funneliformis mosseae]
MNPDYQEVQREIKKNGIYTPDFYEELALQCMNANPELRPTAEEKLQESQQKVSMVRSKFEEADEHIPNIKPTLMNYNFDIHKSKQLD